MLNGLRGSKGKQSNENPLKLWHRAEIVLQDYSRVIRAPFACAQVGRKLRFRLPPAHKSSIKLNTNKFTSLLCTILREKENQIQFLLSLCKIQYSRSATKYQVAKIILRSLTRLMNSTGRDYEGLLNGFIINR